jgi:hypothetical protein
MLLKFFSNLIDDIGTGSTAMFGEAFSHGVQMNITHYGLPRVPNKPQLFEMVPSSFDRLRALAEDFAKVTGGQSAEEGQDEESTWAIPSVAVFYPQRSQEYPRRGTWDWNCERLVVQFAVPIIPPPPPFCLPSAPQPPPPSLLLHGRGH